MSTPNYMTPACHRKLTAELEQLLRTERPEVCQLVQWAAGNGDRSENADYQYGKKRLREIDRRVRFLRTRLDAAVVVDPVTVKSDRVQFGASVTTVDEEGAERTWAIVGVDEIDTAKNHISWQSPIGRSLLGKALGAEVEVARPQGAMVLEIVSIEYRSLER